MTAMQARVINVISRDPAQRSNAEIDILLPWLRKKSQLLQSMEKNVIMDIIRNCQYQKNQRDDVIIRQGDRGDRFYIILAGTVAVYVDPNKSGEDEAPPPDDKKPKSKEDEDAEAGKKEDTGETEKHEAPIAPVKPKKLDRSIFGKIVIRFGPGKSFGEIALISEDNVRNASIIADEDCHFLVIHRDLYNRSLKASQEQEYADRRDFVDSHPLFSRWSGRFRHLLEMSITKEVYSFDSVVQRQGDPVNGLIFIRKGRGKVIVEPGKHAQQYPTMHPFPATNDIYQLEHLRPNKKPLGEVQTNARSSVPFKQEQVAVRRQDGYAAAEKKIHYRSIGLCCVEEGEVLGDIEMIMNLETAMQTVITTSYTEVYILNSKNFDRLVTKKNPATIDVLRMMVETKLASRVHSLQGAQVPLLRYSLFKLVDEIIVPPKKPPPPLRGTKELPERDVLMLHLFDVFTQNKAALVEPYVPGAIYYREMMRDKARIRMNIRKRLKKEKMKNVIKATVRFPRSIAKIKASLEEEQKEEEDRLVEEIRQEQEEHKKMELSRALQGVNPAQLLASQNLPPIFKNKNDAKPQEKKEPSNKVQPSKLPQINNSVPTMIKTRHSNKDTKQVLQVNKPVFITEKYSMTEDEDLGNRMPYSVQRDAAKSEANIRLPESEKGESISSITENKAENSNESESGVKEKAKINEEQGEIKGESGATENKNYGEKQKDKSVHHVPGNDIHIDNISADENAKNVTTDTVNSHKNTENSNTKEETYSEAEKEQISSALAVIKNNQTSLPEITSRSRTKSNLNKETEIPADKNRMKFVNAYVQHRLRFIHENPIYRDWETSDKTLSFLEERIKNFHLRGDDTMFSAKHRNPVKLPKLKRYQVQEGDLKQPIPGGKVWMKMKPCRLNKTKNNTGQHQHQRYFIVPKLPDFERLKRTRMLLHFFMDQTIDKTINEAT